ncbi:restriction endonuclease [Albidovulum sediminis]|uniref:Restriction endonuclease n=1 Tax=Albidovulum sediminis TaxID=3066345 RepID=A0ABT2NN49_9RHOB|nr:restriction endonuclease [Defluviimonas sediminis]MCT8330352.1 restriction endonuclease [Defluviimonas sediminis]
MASGNPTKTTNPIHFEDLDPKRFEDLVRELIYDFRDWQTIEATGKGGDDDGFDIRAFERTTTTVTDDDGEEVVRPMDGNLWMIQCKREKTIPPSKIAKILKDIDPGNPPYGYILAAATNFSKKSYDTFRDELTKLGVLEFYLWGNATLETELHQPKNDRILFTFFGISNVRRKRSRATEIRSEVTNKNRIMRILGENPSRSWILARDSKDRHYPYESKYADFEERPRWKDYEVVELHPRGVIVSVKQCYAWFDEEKRTFDLAEPPIFFSNPYDRTHDPKKDRANRETIDFIRDFWERLPKKNQAMFHLNGIIRYEDMLVIDDKGDSWKEVPHIFVDFVDGQPVSGTLEFLMKGERQILLDDFSLESVFPASFPKPQFGKIHDEEGLALPDSISEQIANFRGNFDTLYDVDSRFAHLKPGDVAVVRFGQKDDRFIQITQRYKLSGSDMLRDDPHLAWKIKQQIEREPRADDVIDVLEFRSCYEHQWKQ